MIKSSMTRIFIPPEEINLDSISISGDNARHLSLVLRVKPGAKIMVFDGLGYRYTCTVQEVHKKEVTARINTKEPYSVESPVKIILAQGIAKGEKMDFIIQKSTELGVHGIVPVITERSQVRNTNKLQRWRKIATSAAQQAGRERVAEITEPVLFNELFLTPPFSSPSIRGGQTNVLKIIFSESYKDRNLKQTLKGLKSLDEVSLLVGPEGGFSRDEIHTATDHDFLEVSLGPRILRTETAPISAISILQYEFGDMG